jgi:hypothetical protein
METVASNPVGPLENTLIANSDANAVNKHAATSNTTKIVFLI